MYGFEFRYLIYIHINESRWWHFVSEYFDKIQTETWNPANAGWIFWHKFFDFANDFLQEIPKRFGNFFALFQLTSNRLRQAFSENLITAKIFLAKKISKIYSEFKSNKWQVIFLIFYLN